MNQDPRSTSRKLDELRAKLDQLRRRGGGATTAPRSQDLLFTAEDLRRKLEGERSQARRAAGNGTTGSRDGHVGPRGPELAKAARNALRTPVPGSGSTARWRASGRASPPEGRRGARSTASGAAALRPEHTAPALSSGTATLAPIVYGRCLPRCQAPTTAPCRAAAPQVALDTAVTGHEAVHPKYGRVFRIVTELDTEGPVRELSRDLRARFADTTSVLLQRVAAQAGTAAFTPADVVFLDLETAGLSSSPLFLIGVMVWAQNGLEIRQFLARNYAEEAAAIGCFLDECAARRVLVTFNGKSFDLPYLRMRAAANGIAFDMEPFHLDLLHECRRIWKGVLPDCRLQTLERHVCGRGRGRDIPGMDIPDAYHAFVRTGNAGQMLDILRHNLLDLVTLADLMTRLPAPSTPRP